MGSSVILGGSLDQRDVNGRLSRTGSRRKRGAKAFLSILVLVGVMGVVPARAVGSATVTLKIAVEQQGNLPCSVTVPEGANGRGVLDQAVADGCIRSYSADSYWVHCVDGICDSGVGCPFIATPDEGATWDQRLNGNWFYLSEYSAHSGDEIALSFDPYVGLCY
jgi:hypothetical protein